MFIHNKYTKWYNSIIYKAQNREPLNEYVEKHHIIPKSLGGSDINDNLVKLTAKEHFICHLLLPKMVTGTYVYKMKKAAQLMGTIVGYKQKRYKINSNTYSILMKQATVPDEVRERMGIAQKRRFKNSPGTFLGKRHSNNTRLKMKIAASKPKSEKWKASASKNRKGKPSPNKGIPLSYETRKKISESLMGDKNGFFGKHHSEEQRQKKRQEKLTAPKKVCYYCNKEIDPMNFSRWHGDKCKFKK